MIVLLFLHDSLAVVPSTAKDDFNSLTNRTFTMSTPGAVVSSLVLVGEAFSLAVDSNYQPAAAATRFGQGRVVVFGHECPLRTYCDSPDTAQLVLQSTSYVSAGKSKPRIAIGNDMYRDFVTNITSTGYYISLGQIPYNSVGTTPSLTPDVYVIFTTDDFTSTDIKSISSYVKSGGGLLAGGLSWWWANSHIDVPNNYPGNKLLGPMGVYISDTTIADALVTIGGFEPLFNAENAALATVDLPDARQAIAKAVLQAAVKFLPLTLAPSFWDAVSQLPALPNQPGPRTPLDTTKLSWQQKFRLDYQSRVALTGTRPYEGDPSAPLFPGVPRNGTQPLGPVTVMILASYNGTNEQLGYSDPAVPVWRTTGLYALPGKPINISIPDFALGAGLGLRIGCHSDDLAPFKDSLARFPQITNTFPLNNTANTTAQNGFGGPIYITVLKGVHLGLISVVISGAIYAPTFILGTSTPQQWINLQRRHPAPWAELVGRNYVISVPSSAVRSLPDPTPLLNFWDQVVAAQDDLAQIVAPGMARNRSERYVVDVDICCGWMHAGYPIMAYLEVGQNAVNLTYLSKGGDWGMFHELGHQHQWVDSVLKDNTETTVNLFTVYAMEYVVGLSRDDSLSAVWPEQRFEMRYAYLSSLTTSSPQPWEVFTALDTHLLLQEALGRDTGGWDVYKTLFRAYQSLIPISDTSNDDDARLQRWVVQISAAAKLDLSPFYKAWGLDVNTTTAASTATYSSWPANPMIRNTVTLKLAGSGLALAIQGSDVVLGLEATPLTLDRANNNYLLHPPGHTLTSPICVGVTNSSKSDAARLSTNKCTFIKGQVFRVFKVCDSPGDIAPLFVIQALHSGLCLVNDGFDYVGQFSCTGGADQHWQVSGTWSAPGESDCWEAAYPASLARRRLR